MGKKMIAFLTAAVLTVLCFSGAYASSKAVYKAMRQRVETEHPVELDLGETDFTWEQLAELKSLMDGDAALHFSKRFCNAVFTDRDTEADLNGGTSKLTAEILEAMITVMPGLEKITLDKHREARNRIMIPLVEKYPEIHFAWLVKLGGQYSVSTEATAFSTFRKSSDPNRLTDADLEPLKYVTGLKALDLGHNRVTDLSFVEWFPEMTVLLLADNRVTDLTPLSKLQHLQYLEIFMNKITDLSPLSACTELKDLNITTCRVTDLSGLDGCVCLERLWASGNRIGQEAKDAFAAVHPDCTVKYKTKDATSDGWRNHPRYTQYIRMLKTGKWEPFE